MGLTVRAVPRLIGRVRLCESFGIFTRVLQMASRAARPWKMRGMILG